MNIAPPEVGQTVELEIADLVYPGKALARLDGWVIFVKGALPGERVRATITHAHKNYSDAHLLEVLSPAPQRETPVCPLALTPGCAPDAYCPGCAYQQVSYPRELEAKDAQFKNLLARMAKVDTGVCRPPVAAPVPLGYRNKITLHADRTETGTRLGYFSEDNTSILDVASCPLACEPISVALTEMRTDTGFLRRLHRHVSVTLRHTHTDGVITYTTDDNASSIPADDRCAPLTEQTSLGLITVPYNSFFQVNPAVAELLLSRVTDLLTQIQPDAVADIYCGVGLFAIAAAKLGIAQTHGVDYDAGAIRTAEINAKRHGLRIRFTAGQAARMTARTMGLCPPARTALVLDPPRRGLDPGVTQAILSSKPADLIYVSCAPDTLTRDIRVLAAAGYEVKSTGILDMFPRTPHFESVTHLSRV